MSNKPTHRVFQVIETSEDRKNIWNRIGSAWEHRNGEGFNVKLNAMPLDGNIVILRAKEDDREEGEQA